MMWSAPTPTCRLRLHFASYVKTILLPEPYTLGYEVSKEGHGRRNRRLTAFGAVPAADAAVPARHARDAPLAGSRRAAGDRPARPQARRRAPADSRRPGHRQRTGGPTWPDPAHRQRPTRRTRPGGLHRKAPRPR